MTDAEIAARLIEALTREAGVGASLVSVSLEMIATSDVADVSVRVERKTRTLLFLSADATGVDGALIAEATSVHKLAP